MVSHEERRRERLQVMKQSWSSAKDPSKAKLYQRCALEWGISWRTFNDYCKILNIE